MRIAAYVMVGVLLSVAASAQNRARDDFSRDNVEIAGAPFQQDLSKICRFETECFEADSCQDTSFQADLTGKAGGLTPEAMALVAKLSSDSGDVELLGAVQGETVSLVGGPVDARHMLTLSGDDARYTVHFADGPLMISYAGMCE